jgi:hypothetical protein
LPNDADFVIGFCPHWKLGPGGGGVPITPQNAYNYCGPDELGKALDKHASDTGAADFAPRNFHSGRWDEPSASTHGNVTMPDGTSMHSWPPKFSLYVVNNTGDPNELDPIGYEELNGTGKLLIGESLVARAEVVENLLFLGRYSPSYILPPSGP